jgi:phage terminase large subunit-like protein
VSGAPPVWSTACLDWRDRIKSGRSIIPPPIFPEEAEAGLGVMRELKIVDAPGSPTMGESCAPWVFELAASIFGAYITEWFVCVPKKNSKSTLAAGVMLTALIRNWRQSAEFIILAPTVEIANNSYGPSRDMCQKDEELEELMHVQSHVKTITHRNSQAFLKVVAADSNTVGGKKAVGILIDEAWLFGEMADAENMLREATGGIASRDEGFIIWLTTQSDKPPAGIFKKKLDYARDVRDGKIVDPRFVPIIYELPEDMVEAKAYEDPSTWPLVNPNMGYSVNAAFLKWRKGQDEAGGADSVRGFWAKHVNVEIGMALRSDRWAGADFWLACHDKTLTLETFLERCEVVVAGIDGGGLDDLLGLSLVGRERGTGNWLHWAHAWAHKIVLERRKEIAPRLLDFAKDGDLTLVEVPGDDVTELADYLCRVRDLQLFPEKQCIGVDAAGIGDIVDELTNDKRKFTLEEIIAISQGWKLNGAIKTTERAVAGKTLLHCGQPLMAWCIGNARTVQVGNAVTINKQVSGSAKIDPLMATFDAVTLIALNPKARQKKYQMLFVGGGPTQPAAVPA